MLKLGALVRCLSVLGVNWKYLETIALLPREATQYFGDCLMPYVDDLLNLKLAPTQVNRAISNAVICQNGQLSSGFRYISGLALLITIYIMSFESVYLSHSKCESE